MSPARFLLIEDDADHAALICSAISQSGLDCEVVHASSGEAGLNILRQENALKPNVLLLDINLSGMGGLQVLEVIKADPTLNDLPVVMLTTSIAAADLDSAYRNHVNSYVVKPTDYAEMKRVMLAIARYWSTVNTQFE
ncbi:MAG: CheY-like chemotaxis protein [Paracoccaceae bacterium]|jgi:CheY-like chemotaxis protein